MTPLRDLAPRGFDRRSIPADAVEGVWRAPDGHAVRRIDWPASASPRGSLLFLPGRADHYEKYLETLAHWHCEGWQVTALDWRGQGLSGRLGADQRTGHVGDFADWIGDLAEFWRAWCAETPPPHVLVGHSMGGHLALRAVAERRVTPDALVLSAPMLRFHPDRPPLALLHAVARIIAGRGDPRRPAWTASERPGSRAALRHTLLTHDEARYADEAWWRAERPGLETGPASWQWIVQALASSRWLERRGTLEAVAMPVLLLSTRADRLVSPSAIRRAARRLPHATLIEFGGEARHELLREVDAVRDRALAAIAEFLAVEAPLEHAP